MNTFQNEKRIILALLALLGGIALATVLLFHVHTRPRNAQITPFPSPVSPTYFPQGQIFTKNVEVVSTDPTEGATNVGIAPTVTVVFSRALSTPEQKAVTLTASPASSFQPSWSTDGTTVSFSVFTALEPSQTYSLHLSYGSLARVWTFTTKLQESLNTQDFQNLQTIGDTAYSNSQAAIKQAYPWIDNLPLSGSTYFTYFDFDTNSFTTHIYYSKNSPLTQSRENAIKNQVTQALRNIGVDTTKYKLVWQPTLVSE